MYIEINLKFITHINQKMVAASYLPVSTRHGCSFKTAAHAPSLVLLHKYKAFHIVIMIAHVTHVVHPMTPAHNTMSA
jgi:hypothetical protein